MTDHNIVGVILAGGLARRMGGGDKCLQSLGTQTLLELSIQRLRPQVGPLLLNVNGDAARFQDYDLPKAADTVPGFAGPLAGILTGMRWAQEQAPQSEWLLSVAADTPFFPQDLAVRLVQQAQSDQALIAVAESGDHIHPVFGLWHVSLADHLHKALVEQDTRKIFRWMKQHPWTQVTFATQPIDPFFNINSPDDLQRAHQLATLN